MPPTSALPKAPFEDEEGPDTVTLRFRLGLVRVKEEPVSAANSWLQGGSKGTSTFFRCVVRKQDLLDGCYLLTSTVGT